MAHGLSDADMKKEHFDDKKSLDEKLDKLAQWIKESKHFIVFTGRILFTNHNEKSFNNLLLRCGSIDLHWYSRFS